MMKLNEKYTNIKSNIQGKLNNIIAYCRENPVQVIEGFGILILSGISAYSIANSNSKDKKIEQLNKSVKELTIENRKIQELNNIALRRINYLGELNKQKDSIMDLTMSDGLRHGSSVAGQQMAYKRWN